MDPLLNKFSRKVHLNVELSDWKGSYSFSFPKQLQKFLHGMHQPREVKQVGSKELELLEHFFYKLNQSFDLEENVKEKYWFKPLELPA